MNNFKCEFIVSPLNNKLSYCKFCNMVMASDNAQKADVFCYKKLDKASKDPNSNVKLIKSEIITDTVNPANAKECSQEQIDQRLAICKDCPFYQDNTCLQCGCALSRDRNYKNKLYFADQSCPIGKWGPVS